MGHLLLGFIYFVGVVCFEVEGLSVNSVEATLLCSRIF